MTKTQIITLVFLAAFCFTSQAAAQIHFGVKTDCGIFDQTVNSLVAAYEELEKLDSSYDETGYCGQGCSIWLMKSNNPTITSTLTGFTKISAPGVSGSCVGEYIGFADFYSVNQKNYIRIEAAVVYTGEDVTLDAGVSTPGLLTEISLCPDLPNAEAFAVNCPSAQNQESCSGETLFGHLKSYYTERFQQVRGYYTLSFVNDYPNIEAVKEVLGQNNTGQGGSMAWTGEELAVLKAYYTVNAENITLKFLEIRQDTQDAKYLYTFVYNNVTRKLLVLKKCIFSV
ncbi:MAG: hypothetical protein GY874_22005 [Desulfobacteraceae bacterium]|nr:hypothetical protein [Desulfobacteraceae bacterium]